MKLSKADTSKILATPGVIVSGPIMPKTHDTRPMGSGVIVLPEAASHGNARHVVTIERWLPTPLNVLLGSHHMVAHHRKTADAVLVAAECLKAGFTRAIGPRQLAYTLVYAKGQRRHDSDAFDKSLRDALVSCGVLRDDSPAWLVPTIPTYEYSDHRATRIIVEDVEV